MWLYKEIDKIKNSVHFIYFVVVYYMVEYSELYITRSGY